ncbi:enoyl-[acyl-carrier-protein] reductase FabK [Desulforamulus putei]|uniref:Probable nitronate monooxygenase n=1 Tax=Desulforamulus putei DSM 12395 TaxID=1121429 RepID=A0A1M5ALS3_9FIRM|nr:enoyl-[acyl-carrier-protein] reductase FabK [Desulforamulus putei]SHF31228.1 enoyl-[acyl-carrier protein] reductase II [Desulforamulus putei DSM 12395]
MKLRTKLCDLLEIEYPILQGGMAWVSTAELAAAVSEAGGLGIIGSGHAPTEWLEEQIKKAKVLTNKPFGVNVMLMSPFVEQNMELIVRERVPVVTTGAGNPGKFIPRLKEVGTKVIPVIPSVALAQRMARAGVDAVIAEGGESGGHIGELHTMPLVPQVVDAVDIPVIAAGGFFDGRGLVAALALGAQGIQMGTRFMCATECTIHDNVKQLLVKAKDRDTVVTGRTTGHPVRIIRNKLAKQFEEKERQGAPVEELEKLGVGRLRMAMVEGDIQEGSVMAGQVCGMIKRVEPAAEIIKDIVTGAEQVLSRLSKGEF